MPLPQPLLLPPCCALLRVRPAARRQANAGGAGGGAAVCGAAALGSGSRGHVFGVEGDLSGRLAAVVAVKRLAR